MKVLFSHQTENESHRFVDISEEVKEERKSLDTESSDYSNFKDLAVNHSFKSSGHGSGSDSEE